MLNITENAAQHLAGVLERMNADPDLAVRLTASQGEWRMRLDRELRGDQVFEHSERTVLVLEPDVAEALDDAILDVEEGEHGPRLRLQSAAGL